MPLQALKLISRIQESSSKLGSDTTTRDLGARSDIGNVASTSRKTPNRSQFCLTKGKRQREEASPAPNSRFFATRSASSIRGGHNNPARTAMLRGHESGHHLNLLTMLTLTGLFGPAREYSEVFLDRCASEIWLETG